MNKIVDADIDCPGCGEMGPFKFRKPSVGNPSRGHFICKICESEFMLEVQKPPHSRPTEVKIFMLAKKISPQLAKKLHVAKLDVKVGGS